MEVTEERIQLHNRWNIFDRNYDELKTENKSFDRLFNRIVRNARVVDPQTGYNSKFIFERDADTKNLVTRNMRLDDLQESIQKLRKEDIGRGIYWRNSGRKDNKQTLIGMSLTITDEPGDRRRLILLNNGVSAIIQPAPKSNSSKYHGLFEEPGHYIFYASNGRLLDRLGKLKNTFTDDVLDGLKSGGNAIVTARSDDYLKREEVIRASELALEGIEKTRKERKIDEVVEDFRESIEIKEASDKNDDQIRIKKVFDEITQGISIDYGKDYREEKTKEALDTAKDTLGRFDRLGLAAEKLFYMQSSLEELAFEHIGPVLIRKNNETYDSDIFGVCIDLSGKSSEPKSLIVTTQGIYIAEPQNKQNDIYFRGNFSADRDFIMWQDKNDFEKNSVYLNDRKLRRVINDKDGRIKLTSNSKQFEDVVAIAEAVDLAQKIIDEKRRAKYPVIYLQEFKSKNDGQQKEAA